MRFFLSILLLAALPAAAQTPLTGRRAPSFSLPDTTTTQHDILDYRGKWLLLDFMQTDCTPCKALSKKLDAIKLQQGDKVNVVSILLTPPENSSTVAKYVAETRSTGTTFLFDQGQVTIGYFKATPQNPKFEIPHLFAVNPAGNIVKDWGEVALGSPTLINSILQLIGGAPTK